MTNIQLTSSFKKAYKKLVRKDPQLALVFVEKIILFLQDPYHAALSTHKLTGSLAGAHAFSIGYDCRVVFYFEKNGDAVFVDIGTHNEVY